MGLLHWAYKEQGEQGTTAQVRAQRWMQSLLELQTVQVARLNLLKALNRIYFQMKSTFSPLKAALLSYLLVPHLLTLPMRCIQILVMLAWARVLIASLPTFAIPTSGQTVEIITAPGARPNAAWLNFVVSSKARAKIRQLLKNLNVKILLILGRRLLNHALGQEINSLISLKPILMRNWHMKLHSIDDLLAEIGLGNAMSVVVARNLQNNPQNTPEEQVLKAGINSLSKVLMVF